jgi:hydrogenase nickel incorporation protein HypA/HybF
MHDYHKAVDMVNYATKKAKETGKKKVTKFNLAVGDSSGYSAESICMYFKEVSAGTICEGAEVVVRPIKSMLQCPSCGEVFPRKLMEYKCPKCGTEGEPSKIGTEVEFEGIEAE